MDFGPLFNAQLDLIRTSKTDDQFFGGKILMNSCKGFGIQEGPTCGLVAIQIAALALELDYVPSVAELFEFCKQERYTKNGESFSS